MLIQSQAKDSSVHHPKNAHWKHHFRPIQCLRLWLVALLLPIITTAASEDSPCPDSIMTIEALAAGIQSSMSATGTIFSPFTQTKTVKELPFPLIAKGRLLIQKPDSIRFEFLEPFESIIVRSGTGFAKYEKNLNWEKLNTGEAKMMDLFFDQLFGWFSGDFDSSRRLFTPALTNENNLLTLRLTSQPDRLKKYIESIEILINPLTFAFQTISIYAANGDLSKMEFANEIRNLEFDPELFEVSRELPKHFVSPSTAE